MPSVMYDSEGGKQLVAELASLASDQKSECTTRHGDCIRICTYTARTVASDTDLDIILEHASRIKYNVIALQNTKMKMPDIRQVDDGTLIIRGKMDASRNEGGVGFIVHPSINLHVRSKKILSPYLAVLRFKLPHKRCVSIINCYSPAYATDDELDALFDKLESAIREEGGFYKFVVGNFNASVGKAIDGEYRVGKHGIGERDENGTRLVRLLSSLNLYHGNSIFEKKENLRWTWKSPDDKIQAEIDHILTNRRWCLFDVGVVKKFCIGSDHRLLRAKVRLSRELEKKWRMHIKEKKNDKKTSEEVDQQHGTKEKLPVNSNMLISELNCVQ